MRKTFAKPRIARSNRLDRHLKLDLIHLHCSCKRVQSRICGGLSCRAVQCAALLIKVFRSRLVCLVVLLLAWFLRSRSIRPSCCESVCALLPVHLHELSAARANLVAKFVYSATMTLSAVGLHQCQCIQNGTHGRRPCTVCTLGNISHIISIHTSILHPSARCGTPSDTLPLLPTARAATRVSSSRRDLEHHVLPQMVERSRSGGRLHRSHGALQDVSKMPKRLVCKMGGGIFLRLTRTHCYSTSLQRSYGLHQIRRRLALFPGCNLRNPKRELHSIARGIVLGIQDIERFGTAQLALMPASFFLTMPLSPRCSLLSSFISTSQGAALTLPSSLCCGSPCMASYH